MGGSAKKRRKISDNSKDVFEIDCVKSFSPRSSVEDMTSYYAQYKVLHVKSAFSNSEIQDVFSINLLRSLFAKMPGVIDASFTIENSPEHTYSSESIFGANACPRGSWYSSFIAQKIGNDDPTSITRSLPLLDMPFLKPTDAALAHTSPIWIFIGKNEERKIAMEGRPEHTDSVQHDGTWHLQCQGSKTWYIRPADSAEWGDVNLTIGSNGGVSDERDRDFHRSLAVTVSQGDIFIINTRLWWHKTEIPYTGRRGYSVSYARDFNIVPNSSNLQSTRCVRDGADKEEEGQEEGQEEQAYTNVDAIYAASRFKAGDVVLTEDELPDCALPRCQDNPTCEVAWLPDGSGALVALVDLKVGDWLTIAPSDDEDGDDEEEEEDVEEN